MALEDYRQFVTESESSVDYWSDVAVSDFMRELHQLMERQGVSQAELARRLGTKRQYISKLLSGGNFTLHTLVKIAMALGAVVRIHLADQGTVTHWSDEPKETARRVALVETRAANRRTVRVRAGRERS